MLERTCWNVDSISYQNLGVLESNIFCVDNIIMGEVVPVEGAFDIFILGTFIKKLDSLEAGKKIVEQKILPYLEVHLHMTSDILEDIRKSNMQSS